MNERKRKQITINMERDVIGHSAYSSIERRIKRSNAKIERSTKRERQIERRQEMGKKETKRTSVAHTG